MAPKFKLKRKAKNREPPQHVNPTGHSPTQQVPGQPPQPVPGHPPQQVPGHPPQQVPGHSPQQVPGHPPQQFPGHPPQQFPGHLPQQFPGYPPQQVPGHPPQQVFFPPGVQPSQHGGYPLMQRVHPVGHPQSPQALHPPGSPPLQQAYNTPHLTRRDPSLPTVMATTSKLHSTLHRSRSSILEDRKPSRIESIKKCIYNKQTNEILGRTPMSWMYIIGYSILYIIFMTTYTMFFLYLSLLVLKYRGPVSGPDASHMSLIDLYTYSTHGVGLTATPTSENTYPVIWYRSGVTEDYQKYIKAVDNLLVSHRRKRDVNSNLGPCGTPPYGYGDTPCVLVRINKQYSWSAKPFHPDSPETKDVPDDVKKWSKEYKNKYWLHCNGYHSYDKEHIGSFTYYPDPPGFDSELFPLNAETKSPLVAVQVSNFTLGISLAIECKLWYDGGVSSVEFLLYIAPKGKFMLRNNTRI